MKKLVVVGLLGIVLLWGVWRFVYVPPRPLFHSLYITGEMELFPSWKMVLPLEDAAGNLVFLDPDLNLLVICVGEAQQRGAGYVFNGMRANPAEARISLSICGRSFMCVVSRRSDAAVFIGPKGNISDIRSLKPDEAGQLFEAVHSDSSTNIVALLAGGDSNSGTTATLHQ